MIASCPVCEKLVIITPAPRDPRNNRPRYRVVEHETADMTRTHGPLTLCTGSGRFL